MTTIEQLNARGRGHLTGRIGSKPLALGRRLMEVC